MTTSSPKNILVIRNDKLGDFMLAWPSFQAVKQLFPDTTIYALVPEYTKPMAELCPWIDEIVLDNNRDGISGIAKTTSKIKTLKIDAALCLHSTPRVALALFLAGIKHRFAPASRIDQILYNHTLTQRRSRSEKPEYEYNVDLTIFLTQFYNIERSYTISPPLLSFPESEINTLKGNFYSGNKLSNNTKLIFIHAGSGGSATNLSTSQYAELINTISDCIETFFVLISGPSEEKLTTELASLIKKGNHLVFQSNKGLVEFAKFLSIASVFICGSTGTLHIAGALNIKTAAFYPAKRSATALRWQTLNNKENRLCFSPAKDTSENGMTQINIHNAATDIVNKFLS